MKRQKKSTKADLESKRIIFKEIGFIITLAIIYLAFGLKTNEKTNFNIEQRGVVIVEEEMIPITEQKIKPPPPPSTIKAVTIIIVDNDIEVEEDITIDAEADQETEIDEYIPPPPAIEIEEETVEESPIFIIVESMPHFPGGDAARIEYLSENLKYPTMARETNIQGKVFVTFVVEKDGSITDVKVLRGIGGGCDDEAIRVIKNMPKWIPGKQRNTPVRVQFNMPIKFMLL